jgi:hypothetical protein
VAKGHLERWSPVAGIAFVVLFVVGAALMDTSPDAGASNSEILGFYGDDGNQLKLECAALVLTAAGVLFVWFIGVLAERLQRDATGSSWLARVVMISGSVFTSLSLAGFMLLVFVADAADDNPARFVISPDTARLLVNAAYTMTYETALPLAAPLVFAVSLATLRDGFLPRWLGWAGLVVTIGCLFGFLGVPMGLFLIWIVVVAVLLVRRPRTMQPLAAVER